MTNHKQTFSRYSKIVTRYRYRYIFENVVAIHVSILNKKCSDVASDTFCAIFEQAFTKFFQVCYVNYTWKKTFKDHLALVYFKQ